MKIIQINSVAYVNADGESYIRVFGLGDDQKVYVWERIGWELY